MLKNLRVIPNWGRAGLIFNGAHVLSFVVHKSDLSLSEDVGNLFFGACP